MEQSESLKIFVRLLNEKHDNLKNLTKELLSILVEENKEHKKEAAQNCLQTAKNLKNMLANQDSPGWLNMLVKSLSTYVGNANNSGSNNALLRSLISINNEINSHNWILNDSQKIFAFDFDAIYEQCKKESRIDELFEQIIASLQKLVVSGDIDSIRIKELLERLIATLNKHSTASYFSLHSMWEFLGHIMKNTLWAQLEAIPALGPFVKGFRKTLEETNVQFEELQTNMKNKMKDKFDSNFNFLNQHPLKILDK